ncbi:MAG TPA: CehA/McbA family metallohydrolase [Steroidobacteraceae bacterium]|nr:CehA/McbA family metallohydrolase [Steroidobacteraceae bacterium]
MRNQFVVPAALLAALLSCPAPAQRLPVLGQIDLPHPYYYREMYLPQLSSGPSSLAWSPDSQELVYSMAGTLWRQTVGGALARQLTAASAYDYQPDWSSDGRWIIYASYRNDAVELWVLDTVSGATRPVLQNGAVNVEPRFSPDGNRIAFVSTAFNHRFHIFVGDFRAGELTHVRRVTGETSSDLPRYYYSRFDHEISPVWSRDGREILYVSNRNHIYGTGGFWRIAPDSATPAREIHYEETNWRARPDFSPDGSRLVFASYVGRSWHNLWVIPAQGGDAFAIGYGDWDQVSPRWSPDGRSIAYVTNRTGNTQIEIMPIPGGTSRPLLVNERQYLQPGGRLHVTLRGGDGQPAAARLSVTDASGVFHAPSDAWIHADDGFNRKERPFEAHYFHAQGEATLDVPAGSIHVEVMQGFGRRLETHELKVKAGETAELSLAMGEGLWSVPAEGHWASGDLHVHMNYGGAYRNTPEHLALQARAEGLQFVESLIVNKEQRFPDIAYNGRHLDPASDAGTLIVHGQEYHTSYWGHLGLLNLTGILLPGYVGYPNTAASSLYPSNADIADLAHAKGATVGYVHPFDDPPHPFVASEKLSNELPVDVALGKVDYMEILGFSDHRTTADVWYRLLNLGFRVPAGAGTDAMADFASLRGPVGMNRVFARVPDGPLDPGTFAAAIQSGRTFATNGPLLGLTVGGEEVGGELHLAHPQRGIRFRARLQSIVPVDHLELVCDGRVARSFIRGKAVAQADVSGTIDVNHSGWCVLRASTDGGRHPVLDNYVYATTSPVYLDVGGLRARSPEDAAYFMAWIDRVKETTSAYPDWNNADEKSHVLGQLDAAREIFAGLRQAPAAALATPPAPSRRELPSGLR